MGAEIPVWVGGLQKWISGLTKKTTCEDIVRALLRAEGRPRVEEKDWRHYVIVERWRKVERPLDSKAKILKVWKTWGEEQGSVRLTLRRLHPMTPKEVKTLRKRPNSKLGRGQGSNASTASRTNTIHPRKLLLQNNHHHHHHHHRRSIEAATEDMDGRITDTMERLMKVIITQGETIQAQLRRLRDKDDQIDFFEQQMHTMRVEELGANYLLDTYLGEMTPTTRSSDGTTEPPHEEPTTTTAVDSEETLENGNCHTEDLRRCVRHYERFLSLCERLEREEEMVLWLTSQIEVEQQNNDSSSSTPAAVTSEQPLEEDILVELELVRERVECLAAQNVANDAEIRENEAALADICRLLDDKQSYVVCLEQDVDAVDEELGTLRLERESIAERPVSMAMVSTRRDKDRHNDTDSNSDTGLSSLHSSSDEGAYVLDTLV